MAEQPAQGVGSLPAVIDTTISTLPQGWKTKAANFLLKVIGVQSAPALTRHINDELDTLAGRKIVSQAMAQAVAARLVSDPQQVDRAVDRFYGDIFERQKNLESVAEKAAEEISKTSKDTEPTAEVSADWRRKFVDYASDVSDPDLQIVWARLLAGEFVKPGSFSFRTLRLVSEMDSSIAAVFASLCGYRIAGNAIVCLGDEWNSGRLYRDSKILEDWGLIHGVAGSTSRSINKDSKGRYFIWGEKFAAMIHAPDGPDKVTFPIMLMTASGRELLKLIPDNDERSIIESVSRHLRNALINSSAAIIGPKVTSNETVLINPVEFIWGDLSSLNNIQ